MPRHGVSGWRDIVAGHAQKAVAAVVYPGEADCYKRIGATQRVADWPRLLRSRAGRDSLVEGSRGRRRAGTDRLNEGIRKVSI